MNFSIDINDVLLNGRHTAAIAATDHDTGLNVERRVVLSDADDTDKFTGEVESAFGSEAAGAARAQIDAAIKDRPPETGTPPIPKPVSIRDLVASHPELREVMVGSLLRHGEVMNVVAAPKARKSWLTASLALCFVARRMWLGMFSTAGGSVLYIDNELHKETIAHRIPRIASALGILSDEYADDLHIYSLRGQLCDIHRLDPFMRSIEPGTYRLIVIDAAYRTFPDGFDENGNADWTRFMNQLDQWAAMLDCAIVLVHHASKGIQSSKSVVDVGAGGSAQARAADTHVIIREHEEADCVVMQAALRSFEPLKPIGLRWFAPCWQSDASLDVTALKRDPSKGGRPKKQKDADAAEKPADEPWTPERFATEFVTEAIKPKDVILSEATRRKLPQRVAIGLLSEAEFKSLVFRHVKSGSNASYYSNKQPNGGDGVCVARTPHTPRVRRTKSAATTGN